MTARAPNLDEARVAAAYADVLERLDRLAEHVRIGDWVGACNHTRLLVRHADRLAEKLTAPRQYEGQVVLAAVELDADAGIVLDLLRVLADPGSATLRALHPAREEARP